MKQTQQFDCYAAQAVLEPGPAFADVTAAQAWVDALRDEPWWHLQGYSLHVLRIEVGAMGKRQAKKHSGVGWYDESMSAGRIELAADGLNTRVVLHEVAHVLAQAVYSSKSHDPAWARTYLTLVSYVMGPDAYLNLQESFDVHGVDYDVSSRSGAIAL